MAGRTFVILLAWLESCYPGFTVGDWWGEDDPVLRTWGSVLVQFTAWEPNARRALDRLRSAGLTTPEALAAVDLEELEQQIRPAGLYRQKARTLRSLARALLEWDGLAGLSRLPPDAARARLLTIPGIGAETADCILLYALSHPTFLGDAYARRVLSRWLGWANPSYGEIRRRVLAELPELEPLQKLHGLVVELGKDACRKQAPHCHRCPLPACRHRDGRDPIPSWTPWEESP